MPLLAPTDAPLPDLSARVQALEEKAAAHPSSFTVPITSFAPEPFMALGEIKAVLEESDGEWIASFYDANVSAQGCNQQEAIDNLKDALLSAFDYLDGVPDAKLGPGPKRQIAVLRQFIGRRG